MDIQKKEALLKLAANAIDLKIQDQWGIFYKVEQDGSMILWDPIKNTDDCIDLCFRAQVDARSLMFEFGQYSCLENLKNLGLDFSWVEYPLHRLEGARLAAVKNAALKWKSDNPDFPAVQSGKNRLNSDLLSIDIQRICIPYKY